MDRSATQTVNNAAEPILMTKVLQTLSASLHLGFGSGTNRQPARLTSIAQSLDRSRNPSVTMHSQVPTTNVLPIQPATHAQLTADTLV